MNTTFSSFSWVAGRVYSVDVYGDFAILDQGGLGRSAENSAFSVVQISTKKYFSCSPSWGYAFKNLRRLMTQYPIEMFLPAR